MGPTILGGLIGAVMGMGLHLIVEATTGFEAPWFAILIGLLTGLGVHQANKSLAGRVSYVRGAIAAVIALAAIVISPQLIAKLAAKNDVATAAAGTPDSVAAKGGKNADDKQPQVAQGDDANEKTARGELRGTRTPGAQVGVIHPGDFNRWQFAYMAIGTFIAYEFGRGSAKLAAGSSNSPAAMDPSN